MFLITSVIVPSSGPLDYTSVRSVFTPEQRLQQTINSIESVRKNTDQKITLVECSNHISSNFDLSVLKSLVDVFIDLSSDSFMLSTCNSPNKSWAEIQMIDRVIDHLPTDERIFKLSGRYVLLNSFDINKFNNGDISARLFIDGLPKRCCGVVYSMKNSTTYKEFTTTCINRYNNARHVSMEDMLYSWACSKDFNVLSSIEASGSIAVSGNNEIY